jgi:hypothetical protein
MERHITPLETWTHVADNDGHHRDLNPGFRRESQIPATRAVAS